MQASEDETSYPTIRPWSGWCVFGASAILGFALWLLAPLVVGRAEPWDGDWPFYSIYSVTSGAALALLLSPRLLSIHMGSWLGQVAAALLLPGIDRSWWALGVVTTGMGSFLFVLGAALAGGLRSIASRLTARCSR